MSFFCNFQSDRCPGQINGNPLNGLCEKVCVQAKKVFDACMQQTQLNGVVLNVTNLTPSNPTYPLTFVSAKSTVSQGVISNLLIDPLPERQGSARVRADITIPVSVAYTDANGVEGVGTATVTVNKDVILNIPSASIMPYAVEAIVSLVSTQGTYTGENEFTIDACVSIILKIVMEVELLLPSYGYAAIPPCQDYTQEVCAGFFELPIFPQ
ncbi:MAG: hypothetical protein E7373_03190 [Clostridiales bacterium]|nr:hypothetical protein [Clostridiales bacterium]